MNREIIALTSIRGVAAIWVLIFHYLMPINRDVACVSCYIPFLQKGVLAVDLFFILSGYILSFVYYDKLFNSRHELSKSTVILFLKARLSRVYPLHLFTLSILVIWTGIMCEVFPEYLMNSRNNIETLIYNIFLVQSWGVWEDASWNKPSWSISAEFFAYLIFPFFIAFVLKTYKQRVVIVGFIMIIVMIIYRDFYDGKTFGFGDGEALYRCLVEFIYGVLGFVITKKNNLKFVEFLEKSWIQIILVIILLCSISMSDYESLVILLYLPLIISISHDNGLISNILKYKGFHYLGVISYSIYLNHALMLFVYRDIRVYFFGFPPSLGLMTESIIFLILTVCTILVSHLTYTYIEDRLRKKLK